MIIGIVIGILIIGVIVLYVSIGDEESTGENSIIDKALAKLSGERKFIQFGAEVVCVRYEYTESLHEIKDDDDFSEKRAKLTEKYHNATDLIEKKYGYTGEELEKLAQQYPEDIDYAKAVIEKVKELCPGAAPELEKNIVIMEVGMYVKITINEKENSSKIKYQYYSEGYISSGSRDSTADMGDIRNTLIERMGEELADRAMEVAIIEYE